MDLIKVKKVFPRMPEAIYQALLEYAPRYGVTPNQFRMFLAQAGHETGEFTIFEENLNYSAQGLANIWPTRYAKKGTDGKYIKVPVPNSKPTRFQNVPNDKAVSLSRKPQAIANDTYANRMGNGGPETNDGWLFRGRGIFQLTGRNNYEAFAKDHPDIPVMTNPDIITKPAEAVISALWFWKTRGLSGIINDVTLATKKINGGTIGLAHRTELFGKLA